MGISKSCSIFLTKNRPYNIIPQNNKVHYAYLQYLKIKAVFNSEGECLKCKTVLRAVMDYPVEANNSFNLSLELKRLSFNLSFDLDQAHCGLNASVNLSADLGVRDEPHAGTSKLNEEVDQLDRDLIPEEVENNPEERHKPDVSIDVSADIEVKVEGRGERENKENSTGRLNEEVNNETGILDQYGSTPESSFEKMDDDINDEEFVPTEETHTEELMLPPKHSEPRMMTVISIGDYMYTIQ
ncbi:hypothetical protein CAPTEDRAFT_192023 [Capitella teleta]|uniref:Uncharacterized protein n=1 Tax=Capitella teleta TaxID=283909 RepID=R7THQ3_CAPTE|nr:hypothetical protein CAPTEDRAFT_192023 [Capitella teleta]|eukprot:ELT90635.1 hypothetical protein CAPTEDRAFT_192023 [Capitella teleta]